MKRSLVMLLIGMLAVGNLTACGGETKEIEATGAVSEGLGKKVRDAAEDIGEEVIDEAVDPEFSVDAEVNTDVSAEEYWKDTDPFYDGRYVMETEEYIDGVPSVLRLEVDGSYAALQMVINEMEMNIISMDGMNYVDFMNEKCKFPIKEEMPTANTLVNTEGFTALGDNMTFVETDGTKDVYTVEVTNTDSSVTRCEYVLDRELGGVSSIKVGSTTFTVSHLDSRTYAESDLADYVEMPEGKDGTEYLLSSFFSMMVIDDMGVDQEVEEDIVPDSEAPDAGLNPVEEPDTAE